METNQAKKEAKTAKPSAHGAIRVRKDTRKRVLAELARINKKDFGRKVRPDEFIALAVSLVTPEHIVKLQESSLSNADRLDRDYKAFIAKNGPMPKDEYLGKRLTGEITSNSDVSGDDKKQQKTS